MLAAIRRSLKFPLAYNLITGALAVTFLIRGVDRGGRHAAQLADGARRLAAIAGVPGPARPEHSARPAAIGRRRATVARDGRPLDLTLCTPRTMPGPTFAKA